MSSVNPLTTPPATSLTSGSPAGAAPKLDSEAFLKMLMVQLRYQDPTKPMNSTDMVSQLADLTTVSSMSGLQKSVEGLSNQFTSSQSLYASTLVGKKVMVLADVIDIKAGESVNGQILLPYSAEKLDIKIYDESDKLVATLPLGRQTKKGEVAFDLANLKNKLPAGKYHMKALAQVGNKKDVEVAITQQTTVTGVVNPGPNQPVLVEVDKIGLVPLANITKIRGNSDKAVNNQGLMSEQTTGPATYESYEEQGNGETELNSWFNRDLLRKYPGLDGSGLVDSAPSSAVMNALPLGQAALALARKL